VSDAERFDAVVIGSGQGGTPLSTAFARAGRRTALIERKHVGGTCINEGCAPTKTMVASARVAYLARRAADYGVHAGAVTVDMVRVRQRKRDIVESFRSSSEKQLRETENLELISGEARFTGERSIDVAVNGGGRRSLSASIVVINTGARPAIPPLDGLTDVPFLDSTSIMELDRVPEHLLVLGGGDVGLEFAQMFRRFGSRVTIVEAGGQLLSHEDADVSRAVREILEQDGVEIVLDAHVSRVSSDGTRIRLAARVGDRDVECAGSHLLVATGRTPNSDALNLSAAGVRLGERSAIAVNDRLETSAEGVFAIGDVKGGPAFTHISYDDYRILKTNLLDHGAASIAGRIVPYTVYIDPQLGRVGLTEHEARKQYANVRVATLPMTSVARALEVDESRGFMKALIDGETGKLLGAAVLGIEGGELMSMLELAIMGGLQSTDLRDTVFAHPTLAESLNNLFAKS
jgi:pyruvate/2-oxoglutarate dehydrogenase complex dihydrolipoamide dehydrogenase (E3) component